MTRNPITVAKDQLESDVELYVGSIIESFPTSAKKLQEIKKATEEDPVLSKADKLTLAGKYQCEVPDELVVFFKQKSSHF